MSEKYEGETSARAYIAELEAELAALRSVYGELTGKDWDWDPQPREDDH